MKQMIEGSLCSRLYSLKLPVNIANMAALHRFADAGPLHPRLYGAHSATAIDKHHGERF